MIIISYDISDDKVRNRFSKLLIKYGAIRLQYSVYEFNNTNRLVETLLLKIEAFSKKFTGGDSIVIFRVHEKDLVKYGNAIHRDADVIYI